MPGWSENMVFSFIFFFLNESKSEVIVFGPSENSGSRNIDLDYLAHFTSSCIKNPDVFWDQGLKFDKQINVVISSCFYQLRLPSKIKYFLSVKTLEIAIHALITTCLNYCNSLYLGISKSSTARLQLVQNAAAKFLKGQCKFDHVTPILKSLHWLPVHLRIEFKMILYVFKSINNLAPSYLSDQLYPYNPTFSQIFRVVSGVWTPCMRVCVVHVGCGFSCLPFDYQPVCAMQYYRDKIVFQSNLQFRQNVISAIGSNYRH